MKRIVLSVIVTCPVVLAAQVVTPLPDGFVLVSDARYEGAIIPASSPWHGVFVAAAGPTSELGPRGSLSQDSWTPTPQDIGTIEGVLQTLVERAARQAASQTNASPAGPLVRGDIQMLAANLPAMKRQYVGVIRGRDRLVVVHGFPDDPSKRWQTEVVMMLGGWCQQFWSVFSTTAQQIERISCGSYE